MIPEDISHLAEPGGEVVEEQQPQPEPEQIETPVETVTFKVRGEERQIPVDRLDALSETMGVSRDATLMWLQTGKDAGDVYRDLRQREREQERQQRSGYQQPQSQPQYGQQQNGLPDDPVELLRLMAQRQQQLEEMVQRSYQTFEEQQRAYQQEKQQELLQREQEAISSAFKRLVETKKAAGLPVPDFDTIEREVIDSGMARKGGPAWEQAFERAYRNLYFEDYGRAAERRAIEKLRDPNAKITIAGGGSTAPKPQPANTAADKLAGLTWTEGIQFLPEAR